MGLHLAPSPLTEVGEALVVNIIWSDEERQRWDDFQASAQAVGAGSNADIPPYIGEPEYRLEQHYGGDFHSLLTSS